jgi:hypothetical protein
MKYTLIVLIIISFSAQLSAQVAINQDNSNADASAMLEIKSTDKGVLIPRMTIVQRDNISSPATGLMVYNTDTKQFNYFNGIAWTVVGDDLGNHTATQNIQLGSNYISNDGDNEGISINTSGELSVKSTSPNNRLGVFKSDYNGGAYIEVNNDANTRALFGPGGGGFSESTNDVIVGNWSNGGLYFYTNASRRAMISNTGIFETYNNFKANPGGAPSGSSVEISSPSGDLGLVLNRGNGSGGVAQRWDVKVDNDNSFDIRSSNTSNGMNIATDGTVNVDKLKITGGSPAEGKVLTTDADGDIVLEEPADRIVYRFDQTLNNDDANNLSGWHIVSDYTDPLSVKTGDVVTIRMTFSAGIAGGSGTDELRFRVYSGGASGCPHEPGGETTYLNVYENNRDADIQTSIQHTFTSTCNGTYQFALQSDYTNVDDDVIVDQVQITAAKY